MSRSFDGGDYLRDDSGSGTHSGAGHIPIGTQLISVLVVAKLVATTEQTLEARWESGSGNLNHLLRVDGSTHKLTFHCHNGNSAGSVQASSIDAPTGAWHWLAGSQSGSVIRVNIDGVDKGSNSSVIILGGDGQGEGAPLCVGSTDPASGFVPNGTEIQGVFIWKRSLTEAEYATLYNGGVYDLDIILAMQSADLVDAWDLDDISDDLSAGSYALTNHGSTLQLGDHPTLPTPPVDPPVADVAPVILGTTTIGSTLSLATPGTYTGDPVDTTTYKWQVGGVDIGGQTNPAAYVSTHVGDVITLLETVTNDGGTTSQSSNAITVTAVVVNPPVASAPPVITGSAVFGHDLSLATPGVYTGDAIDDRSYQWRADGVDISMETDPDGYSTVEADIGKVIRLYELAENDGGSANQLSNAITITDTAYDGPSRTLDRGDSAETVYLKMIAFGYSEDEAQRMADEWPGQ